MLLDRLHHDSTLCRLCGWHSVNHIPSEAAFSCAFAELVDSALPSRLHEALMERTGVNVWQAIFHVIRRRLKGERATPEQPAKLKRRRGRPRKGEEQAKEPCRLERQSTMILAEMRADLPRFCDIGVKRDAKGYQRSWSGYKFHIDAAVMAKFMVTAPQR